ncbi:hypothetical protein [Bacillus sp. X1(2014)]|uniref:hypothetical protein n=1 Tax=Bacillus sp. X1(2014) TaxID=1565991 RepID=UPI0011A7FE4F|nr:hypothetical protein [Bacillus sp. X1(2014)]
MKKIIIAAIVLFVVFKVGSFSYEVYNEYKFIELNEPERDRYFMRGELGEGYMPCQQYGQKECGEESIWKILGLRN